MIRALAVILAALLAAAAPASAQSDPAAHETLAEIRVHGNHTTSDAEVLALTGLTIGQALAAGDVEAARKRLDDSGRFQSVEIRKRSRSLEDSGEVALIVLVREHPVPEAAMRDTPAPLRPFRRLWASGMFFPVFGYADGYGFTYGARFTFVDLVGRGSRISVPLTWGGTKRAAAEVERRIPRGPIDRLTGSASLSRRTNPFYGLDEDRREVAAGASRAVGRVLRVGVRAGYGSVTFGLLDERLASYGADATLDTRQDPVFPRNALYVEAGWTALRPSISGRANAYRADIRAYRALFGQSVVSLRGQYSGADAPLPPYQRALLGGAGSVRGYRAGSESGDNLVAATIEIRTPLTSPMGISRAGFSLFTDVGKAWDHGRRFEDSQWRRGAGAGLFFLASVFQLNLDVGVRRGGGVRAHFSTGLQF
jgi:hypothetical protein